MCTIKINKPGFLITFLIIVIICFITPLFSQNIITKAGGFDVYPVEEDGEFVTNNMIGFYDSVLQREYVIVSRADTSISGLGIFDVTIPSTIQRVGFLNTDNVFGVKVYKKHAFTIGYLASGVDVFDITDVHNPVYKNHIVQGAHTMVLDMRGFLYLVTANGFSIYDLTDPANPLFIKDVLYTVNGAWWHDGIVKQNKLIIFSASQHTLIYDLTDPLNPVLIGLVSDPSMYYSHSGDISENGSYLFICDELNVVTGGPDVAVWDISDLNNPTKVGQIDDTSSVVHNVYVKGNYLYVAYYKSGFRIYNITNPSNPLLVDQYKTFGVTGTGGTDPYRGCFDVYSNLPSGTIAALDSDSGLFIFSIAYSLLTIEVKDYDKAGISIFPNPAREQIHLEIKDISIKPESITMYDMLSKQVVIQEKYLNEHLITITTNTLSKGVYVIALADRAGNVYRKKVIKE